MTRRLIVATVAAVLAVLGLAPAVPAVADGAPPGPPAGTLVVGTPRTLTFDSSSKHIILRVYVRAPSQFYLEPSNSSPFNVSDDVYFDIYGPVHDGTSELVAGTQGIPYGFASLSETGWYTLDLYTEQGATGSLDITASAERYQAAQDAGSISAGQTRQFTLDGSPALLAVHFFGRAGDRPTVFCPQVSIKDSSGNASGVYIAFSGPDGVGQPPVDRSTDTFDGCGTSIFDDASHYYTEGSVLNQTGQWTMKLYSEGTGTVTLRLDIAHDQPTAPLATQRSSTIAVRRAGVNVYRTVHLDQGQRLTLALSDFSSSRVTPSGTSGSAAVLVDLFAPNEITPGYPPDRGDPVPTGGGLAVFSPAAVSGTYVLEFNAVANTTFSLVATPSVFRDVNVRPTIGTPTRVTITQPGQAAHLRFHVPVGQNYSLTSSGSTFPHSCPSGNCAVEADDTCGACSGYGVRFAADIRQAGSYTPGRSTDYAENERVDILPLGHTTGSVTLTVTLSAA